MVAGWVVVEGWGWGWMGGGGTDVGMEIRHHTLGLDARTAFNKAKQSEQRCQAALAALGTQAQQRKSNHGFRCCLLHPLRQQTAGKCLQKRLSVWGLGVRAVWGWFFTLRRRP